MNPDATDPSSVSDTDLAQLAHHWRARAMRGDRKAFGPAHAFEAEQRRRLRDSFFLDLEPNRTQYQTASPWWKFW